MSKIHEALTKFGLSEKEIKVYLALLKLGPSPVRKIALEAKVNRGTTYDILKNLQELGLVAYYHKETRQYFVAEDPRKLFEALRVKQEHYELVKRELKQIMPQLRSLSSVLGHRPVVTYYDGTQGVRSILQDVLDKVVETDKKEYYVYSSSTIKRYLYAAFPDYTDERIKRNIRVRAISIGPGGQERGLDQRKWLSQKEAAPTYSLVYAGSLAMISTNKNGMPIGFIVEDNDLYETQKLIFESLWEKI
jgi:sugar-specific transcriptional regulator TrmB